MTTVVEGVDVTIDVTSHYLFDDLVAIRVWTAEPVEFSIQIPAPSWLHGQGAVDVRVDGEPIETVNEENGITLRRTWHGTAQLTVDMETGIRIETHGMETRSVTRGALVFVLPIEEEWRQIGYEHGWPTWEVHPQSTWNYGLIIDSSEQEFAEQVNPAENRNDPFAAEQAPITIRALAQRLPMWTIKDGAADHPPSGAKHTSEPIEELHLVPYAGTTLRITQFPIVDMAP